MGEFTTYCTFCSGPLKVACDIGHHIEAEQRARRAWIDRRIYWKANKIRCYDSEDEDEDVKVERLKQTGVTEDEENLVRDEGDQAFMRAIEDEQMPIENIYQSHDPELLSHSDVEWLERSAVGLLIWDRDVPENEQKLYLVPIEYEDCGTAWTLNPNNDPELPPHNEEASRYCFCMAPCEIYPLHQDCLEVFSWASHGTADTGNIDRKALFRAFESVDDLNRLKLPYGDHESRDLQGWLSIAGDEYALMSPLTFDPRTLSEVIAECQSPAGEESGSALQGMSAKVKHDPFRSLPAEVTDMIIDYLPRDSIAQLLIASWTLHCRAQTQGFWRRRIHQDMPWAWELQEIFHAVDTSSLNFGKLYKCIDEASKPRYGMKDKKWLALANRRRIWLPCEILAGLYHKARTGKDLYELAQEEEVFSLDNNEESGIPGLFESEADAL